jgi:hypothetical protein
VTPPQHAPARPTPQPATAKQPRGGVLAARRRQADEQAGTGADQEVQVQNDFDLYAEMQLDTAVINAPDFCLLTWWKQNEKKFPSVARMARQFLATPASSAEAERLFSYAGRLHGDLSSRTTDEHISMRCRAYYNAVKRR